MKSVRCPHCRLVNRLDSYTCLRCKLPLAQTAGAGMVMPRPAPVAAVAEVEEAAVEMERPMWVTIGLWGLKTKSAAWGFAVLSVLAGVAIIVYWGWIGAIMFLATLWYVMAIRWVDKNSFW